MNTSDLTKLQTEIAATLANLEAANAMVRSILKESSEVGPNFLQDESDSAKAENDLQNALEIHRHNAAQLSHLRDAFSRLENGTYGICQCCEEKVDLQRLEVNPESEFCIECQEDHEHRTRSESLKIDRGFLILMRWAA
jgi:DnaK suppressor protein